MNREECLDAAKECVLKDRQNDYGTPEDNFRTISGYWNNYIASINGRSLTAHDVSAMMILVKVARMASSPMKADNWVDTAGYAATGAELTDRQHNAMPSEI